jgi:hypothetical protein
VFLWLKDAASFFGNTLTKKRYSGIIRRDLFAIFVKTQKNQ